MTKAFVDSLIQNMKKAEIVTKATPWMVEGMGEKEMHVRFVGIKPYDEWLDIFSEKNNLLLKFIIDKTASYFEFYLANKPPFTKIITRDFKDGDKWEVMLGDIKRRLHKDKIEVVTHISSVGNMYERIQKEIK
jgi:hypothetical protein